MASQTAIITRDHDRAVIGWSAGAVQLSGFTAAEVLGTTLDGVLHVVEPERESNRPVRQARGELVTKAGTKLPIVWTASPVYDEHGQIVGFTEVVRPYTEPATARQTSAHEPGAGQHHDVAGAAAAAKLGDERELFMRVLLDCTPHGCVVIDELGRITVVNAAARSMFGYEESELATLPIHVLVPRDERAVHESHVRAFIASPSARRMAPERDLSVLRKDGSRFPAQIDLGAFQIDSGRFVVATVLDLTTQKALERLAAESESRFLQMTECLPQLVFTCRPDGVVDFLTERWGAYSGIPTQTLLEWGWLEILHPDDRPRATAAIQHAVQTITEYRIDVRIRRGDGVYRWFDTRASPLRDAQGRVLRWFGSSTDVTESRENRDALEHERERLQSIIDTAPGVYVSCRSEVDGSTRTPLAAPGVVDIFGFTPEQLARDASPIFATMHPQDLPRVREEIALSKGALNIFRSEYRVAHPTRGELWVEAHSRPTRDPDGATVWNGFVRDITERKIAEESLRAAQAQLVAALDAGDMGISVWDVADDRLHMDDALLRLLGRTRDALDGTLRDALASVHPEDVEKMQNALHVLSTEGSAQDFEYRIPLEASCTKWIGARGRAERDEAGRIVRVTTLHMDTTLQKRVTEAQLRAQKLEALGTLAGGIAHDFNNILQAIVGNTALVLRMLPSDHRTHGFLEAIEVAAARASDLVRRILAFSRPEEQAPSVLRLSDAVAEALKLARPSIPEQLEIRAELGASVPSVAAEPTQIHQIVLNLLTNAAHAIGDTKGVIRVQLAVVRLGEPPPGGPELPEGTYALLQVADNGDGMSPETLARIFDPFFTTKPVGRGTGLGLSVVHGIMKSLGGAITVRSAPGRGTTFSLYFPGADETVSEPTRGRVGVAAAQGERVLFIDDEPMLVTLTTSILEMLGYRASGYTDPAEALRQFNAQPARFDAVVTDVSMPGISGFQLAQRIRAVREGLPIIMMSGHVGPEETARATELGVSALLLKPVSIEDLSRALSRALER